MSKRKLIADECQLVNNLFPIFLLVLNAFMAKSCAKKFRINTIEKKINL
jgi:hypothetical protein